MSVWEWEEIQEVLWGATQVNHEITMRIWKFLLLPIWVCLSSSAVFAQDLTTGDLEKACASSDSSDRMMCLLMVGAFRDGFIEGVGKGVIDTYRLDEQICQSVRDVRAIEMTPRINEVTRKATCVQRTSTKELISGFLAYIRQNPQVRQQNYRVGLTRAISSRFCPR